MTVDELVAELRKHPGDTVVGIYDHDEAAHFAVYSVDALSRDESWGPLTAREEPPDRAVVLKI